jgi:ribosome hibernation promoting factor
MVITTTARHMEVDRDVKEFAETRLAKLERYASDIREAHIVLHAEKYRIRTEIILRLKHQELIAKAEQGDVRGSLDQAVQRLEHQLQRLKEKRASHGKGAPRPDGAAPEPPAAGDEGEDWDDAGLAGGMAPE